MTTIDLTHMLEGIINKYDLYIPWWTCAYIISLLQPLATIIQDTPLDDLALQLRNTIPGEFGDNVLEKFVTQMRDRIMIRFTDYIVRLSTMTFILKSIVDYVNTEVEERGGTWCILPWDVQRALSRHYDSSRMLNLREEDTKLPVKVTVNDNESTYELTEEFTVGLIIARYLETATPAFGIDMFGTTVTDGVLHPKEYTESKYDLDLRYLEPGAIKYSVNIRDHAYVFTTPEFMQGFITGMNWRNLNHKDYWKELTQYQNIEDREIRLTLLQIN